MRRKRPKLPVKLIWVLSLIVIAGLALSLQPEAVDNQKTENTPITSSGSSDRNLECDELASVNPCLYIGCSSFF